MKKTTKMRSKEKERARMRPVGFLIYLVMAWAKEKSGQTSFGVLGLCWICAGEGCVEKIGSKRGEVFSGRR